MRWPNHKVALQFSGGKDSLACLYLLKEYLNEITVYFLDSGDIFPETQEVIDRVKLFIPNFITIKGRQPETIKQYGWPSDVVSVANTDLGLKLGHFAPKLQDRYSCCARSIMAPMHERMLEDNITLLIRGQKNADDKKPSLRSAQVVDGIELFYPIENWTDQDVFSFLQKNNVELPRYYKNGMPGGPDCMSCTAWMEHKMPQYLSKFYPEKGKVLKEKLQLIQMSVEPAYNLLKETIYV